MKAPGLALKYAFRHMARAVPVVQSRVRAMRVRERLPMEQLQIHQEALLRRALLAASQRLPAYRSLQGQVPQTGLHAFLRTLPVIDKQALLHQRSAYYPHEGRPRPWYAVGKTSGTTGTPLDTFRSYDSTLWEQAFCCQHWEWAGWRPGEKQVVLRGDLVVASSQTAPPFWFHDRVGEQLFVSTRHLTAANVGAIAAAIDEHAPTQLRAYPSAAYRLATLLRDAGIRLRAPLRSVITSSELLMPLQRETVEAVFGARVFDHYGMAERVAFAAECEHGKLHVNPEYAVVELLDADGRPADGAGFVVGTTLHNLAMPLIRYRLTDVARWGRGTCACGRSYPYFESVGGRLDDQLYDLDGEPVSPAVITFAFKGVPLIAQAQVAQTRADEWVVRVVAQPGFAAAHQAQLLNNFHALVSGRIRVRLQLVDQIPLLASGKFKWVSQEFSEAGRRAVPDLVA